MSAASLVLLAALAQVDLTWQADVRAGARARNPMVTDGPGEVADDVELAPHVGAGAAGGGYSVLANYTATLRSRQPQVSFRAEHSHLATLQAEWRREGRARPFFFQAFSYGTLDITNLTPTPESPTTETPRNPETPLDPVPRLATLLQFFTDTTLGVEVPLSAVTTWTLTGGFNYGGGADDASRAFLALAGTGRLSTSVDWQASRLDALSLILDARMAVFTIESGAGAAEFLGAWRRRLLETMNLELRIGFATTLNVFAEPEDLNVPWPYPQVLVLPVASVAWNHRFVARGTSLGIWANVGGSPFVDRFNGLAYERLNAQGGGDWALGEWLSLKAGGGATLAVGAEQSVGSLVTTFVDATLSVHPQTWWRLDLYGARSVVSTDLPALDGSPRVPVEQWVAGLNFSVSGQGHF